MKKNYTEMWKKCILWRENVKKPCLLMNWQNAKMNFLKVEADYRIEEFAL